MIQFISMKKKVSLNIQQSMEKVTPTQETFLQKKKTICAHIKTDESYKNISIVNNESTCHR